MICRAEADLHTQTKATADSGVYSAKSIGAAAAIEMKRSKEKKSNAIKPKKCSVSAGVLGESKKAQCKINLTQNRNLFVMFEQRK